MAEVLRITRGLPMPDNYYKGSYNDGLFIHNLLSRLTIKQRETVAMEYSSVYTGEDSRQDANRRLTARVERLENTNRGVTLAPPMMRK